MRMYRLTYNLDYSGMKSEGLLETLITDFGCSSDQDSPVVNFDTVESLGA